MSTIPQGYVLYKGEWCHPSRVPGAKPDLVLDNGTKVFMPPEEPKKRIRQSSKPVMNKLEAEFLEQLKAWYPSKFYAQSVKFKIGNGVTFCPDIFCFHWNNGGDAAAWEVKGPHAWDDAIVKLKCFASVYPEIRVHLAWKDKKLGSFRVQDILP